MKIAAVCEGGDGEERASPPCAAKWFLTPLSFTARGGAADRFILVPRRDRPAFARSPLLAGAKLIGDARLLLILG